MFLRQSTSQVVRFGPCLDIADGVTEETALTLAQADMRLSKDGGAFAQKSAAGNATHDSDGWYSTTLSTTDTDTVGMLKLNVHQPANMFPVWENFYVVEEAVYDAMYAAAAVGPATATAMSTAQSDLDTITGAAGALLDSTATSAQLVNDVWDEAMVETTGAPAVTGTFRAALQWMFGLSRNKITQTATTTTLRNDADDGDLATSTVSDDATTYTRGEWST